MFFFVEEKPYIEKMGSRVVEIPWLFFVQKNYNSLVYILPIIQIEPCKFN